MESSFYTDRELQKIGFRSIGNGVLLSRNVGIYEPDKISIGSHVRIDDYCVLSGGAGIVLGSYIHIACFCALYGGAGIRMEDFSGLSSRVAVYSITDDFSGRSMTNPMIPDNYKPKLRRRSVLIGRHAVIGTASTILPGVEICEGAAIGAHSMVIKKCLPWTMYAGVPATRTKERSQNALELEKQFLSSVEERQSVSER